MTGRDKNTRVLEIGDLGEPTIASDPTGVHDLSALLDRVTAPSQWTVSVLSGSSAGVVMPLDGGALSVGRSVRNDLPIADEGMSREHGVIARRGDEVFVRDLNSTNGTFVGDDRVTGERQLEDGDTVRFGSTFVHVQLRSEHEVQAMRSLYESSVRDPLTKLYNRGHFDERLASELAFAQRHRTELSLTIDLDHFKQINDTHGHPGGDTVLQSFAQMLARAARKEDIVARYGGEEFVAILRDVGAYGAEVFAQRIRRSTESLLVAHGGKRIPVTASIGVATWSPSHPYPTVEALVAAADRCLYRAKQAGRNLVICDASPRSAPPP